MDRKWQVGFDARLILERYRNWEVIQEYVGGIDEGLITETLDAVSDRLSSLFPGPYVRKVYIVLVEMLQNLYHHADYYPEEFREGLSYAHSFGAFKIGVEGGACHMLTGNFVSGDQMRSLRYRIDELNNMSADQIRIRYKAILNNQSFSSKGGGGLGLVDMMRRSQSPLQYAFVQLAEEYYFYTLLVSVTN